MPYKDPERKRRWEQAHRKERTERRKSQRRASRQCPRSSFVSSPSAETRAEPANRAATKARPSGATKAHPLAKVKKARGLRNRPTATDSKNKTSGWDVLLGIAAAVVLGIFFGSSWGFPGEET